MAQALDEPFVVVGLDERENRLAQAVNVVGEFGPLALLFEGPDVAFGHAVALGLTDEGGVAFDPERVTLLKRFRSGKVGLVAIAQQIDLATPTGVPCSTSWSEP